MGIQVLSPVGRIVQGSLKLEVKRDDNNQPKIGSDGQPEHEVFLALAVHKSDPHLPAFIAAIQNQARAEFPHLFTDGSGVASHPQFAWKYIDGDTGVDTQGKPVNTKTGYAGHVIFKMQTKFVPACFHSGRYNAMEQIQDPENTIKRGYYVRVATTISGNGVAASNRAHKPGMFLSPNMIEFVAPGEEIRSGPDAAAAFGGAPAPVLPPGVSGVPAPAGYTPAPPAPVAAYTPAPPAPAPVPAPPAPVPAPPAPAPAAPGLVQHGGHMYRLTDKAQGATLEALKGQGWTEEVLIAHGLLAAA